MKLTNTKAVLVDWAKKWWSEYWGFWKVDFLFTPSTATNGVALLFLPVWAIVTILLLLLFGFGWLPIWAVFHGIGIIAEYINGDRKP